MPILRIRDVDPRRRVLAFDLKDILAALQPHAGNAMWEVDDCDEPFEATGENAATVEALVGTAVRVPGDSLVSLAQGIIQVIWGEFRSFRASETSPWVTVRAIDSSWYEVETDDPDVLAVIREKFNEVQLTD